MTPPPVQQQLRELSPADPRYAVRFVDALLAAARAARASDVHVQPTPDGYDVRWRVDGVLQPLGVFPQGGAADIVVRLKVLADLLTYRCDIPQEGRLRHGEQHGETRLSTFPTLHGERAVARLFAPPRRFESLAELLLPAPVENTLRRCLHAASGAVLAAGPAGSGKTTTVYACLRELSRADNGARCVLTIEDPIEGALPGVAQSRVNPAAGFDLAVGLRSLLRQDADVVLVGEIRDPPTAEAVFQAAFTGHLVWSTFHAGSAVEAVCRLREFGVPPYLLRGGLLALVHQRLARRLCECAAPTSDPTEALGLPVPAAKRAVGCPRCQQTGYVGRFPLAEPLPLESPEFAAALLAGGDAKTLEREALAAGMASRWEAARRAVEAGLTSPAEIRRVLGS